MQAEDQSYIRFVQGPVPERMITELIHSGKHLTHHGAQQIFIGQVRADKKQGKQVRAIDFQVYHEMALGEMKLLASRFIKKYPDVTFSVIHSEGVVPVGGICFVVHVTAGHRGEVFNACADLVNDIKKDLPIFGKEIMEDESYSWKENKE